MNKKIFQRARSADRSSNGDPALNSEEFLSFYYSLFEPPELHGVFLTYVRDHPLDLTMTLRDIQRFLRSEQKMKVTIEDCKTVVETFEKGKNDGLSFDGKKMVLCARYVIGWRLFYIFWTKSVLPCTQILEASCFFTVKCISLVRVFFASKEKGPFHYFSTRVRFVKRDRLELNLN